MLKKYFRFVDCLNKETWHLKRNLQYALDFYIHHLWSHHNYMKYLPRIQRHSLWCMTDDFHPFTHCAGIPMEFLLNISTWSIPFYPANPYCTIIMGEGLKVMHLKLFEHIWEENTKMKGTWQFSSAEFSRFKARTDLQRLQHTLNICSIIK